MLHFIDNKFTLQHPINSYLMKIFTNISTQNINRLNAAIINLLKNTWHLKYKYNWEIFEEQLQ